MCCEECICKSSCCIFRNGLTNNQPKDESKEANVITLSDLYIDSNIVRSKVYDYLS